MNRLLRQNFLFPKSAFSLFKMRASMFCTTQNQGTLVNLTKADELDKHIKENDAVIVDFYADWCGPCKKLGPVLEDKLKTKKFTLVKINVDKFPELSEKYDVGGIPYIVLYKKGVKSTDFAGFNQTALNKMIDSI